MKRQSIIGLCLIILFAFVGCDNPTGIEFGNTGDRNAGNLGMYILSESEINTKILAGTKNWIDDRATVGYNFSAENPGDPFWGQCKWWVALAVKQTLGIDLPRNWTGAVFFDSLAVFLAEIFAG